MRPQRLVLWDVDGTLLSAGPVAREVFGRAVEAVAHRQIMEQAGLFEGEARLLLPRVLAEMERLLEPESERIRTEGRVFPGVAELVTRFHRDPRILQSVLTGNLLATVRIKLRAFGLDRFVDPRGRGFRERPSRPDAAHPHRAAPCRAAVRLAAGAGRRVGDRRHASRPGVRPGRWGAVLADLADTDAVARLVMDGALPSP